MALTLDTQLVLPPDLETSPPDLEAPQDDPGTQTHSLSSTRDFHPSNSRTQNNNQANDQEQDHQDQKQGQGAEARTGSRSKDREQKQGQGAETLNLPVSLATYGQQAKDYAKQAKAHNTRPMLPTGTTLPAGASPAASFRFPPNLSPMTARPDAVDLWAHPSVWVVRPGSDQTTGD